MIKAAIIGATGFTGSELVRILLGHPDVELIGISSESRAGEPIPAVHPQFEGFCDLTLVKAEEIAALGPDICFLALPHRVSMSYVKDWQDAPFRIVDLSGDFRLGSASTYEAWYGTKHVLPDLVGEVPYGLPELERDRIPDARIVANPGCYPTATSLALAPLLAEGLVKPDDLVVDAKSGTTGAGVKPSEGTHFTRINDNFRAYGLLRHRHTVEIEECLGRVAGTTVQVQFTPHLLPVDRGILVTAYARPVHETNGDALQRLYREFYADAPFVRLREAPPELKDVRGTNLCDIHVAHDPRTGRILVLSAIDNLVKGAAGQAVQCANLICGLSETTGLPIVGVYP